MDKKWKIGLIAGLLLIMMLEANALTTSNLIAHYNFDQTSGNLLDTTRDHNGIPKNIRMSQTGKIGYAWDWNTATSDVNLGTDFIGTQAITVCAWLKPYSRGGSNYGRILDNGKYIFQITDGNLLTQINDGGTYRSGTVGNPITMNTWSFYCTTRNTDGNVTYYKNGTQIQFNPPEKAGTPAGGTTQLHIGNKSTLDRDWNGLIDEMSIWKSVLTYADMNQLYNNGNGRTYPFTVDEPTAGGGNDTNHRFYLDNNQAMMGIFFDPDSDMLGQHRNTVTDADKNTIDYLSQYYNLLTMDVPAKHVWIKYSGTMANDFNFDAYDAICAYAKSKGMQCQLQIIIDTTGYYNVDYYTFLDTNFTLTKNNYQNNYPNNTPTFTNDDNSISMWDLDFNTIFFYANKALATHYAGDRNVISFVVGPNEGMGWRISPENTTDANYYWQMIYLPNRYDNNIAKLNATYGGTTYTDFNYVPIPWGRTGINVQHQMDWWNNVTKRASILHTEIARALKTPDQNKIITTFKILNEMIYPDTEWWSYGYRKTIDLNYYTNMTKNYVDYVSCDIYASREETDWSALYYETRLSFCTALGDTINKPVFLGEYYSSAVQDSSRPHSHDANMNALLIALTLGYVGHDLNSGVRGLSVFTYKGYPVPDIKNLYDRDVLDLFNRMAPTMKTAMRNYTTPIDTNFAICENTNVNVALNLDMHRKNFLFGFLDAYRLNDNNRIKTYFNRDCNNATEKVMYANHINIPAQELIDLNSWITRGGTLITGYRFADGNETQRSDYGTWNSEYPRSTLAEYITGLTDTNFLGSNNFDVQIGTNKKYLTGTTGSLILDLSTNVGAFEQSLSSPTDVNIEATILMTAPFTGEAAITSRTIGAGKSIHIGFSLWPNFDDGSTTTAKAKLNQAIRDILNAGGKTLSQTSPNDDYYAYQSNQMTTITTIGNATGTYNFPNYSTIKFIDGNNITDTNDTHYHMELTNAKTIIATNGTTAGDTTAPTTTLNNNAEWNTITTITFTCTDTESTCTDINFSINDGDWNTTTWTGTLNITLTDGNNKIEYKGTDALGNEEAINTEYHALDTTAPVTTMSGCGTGWNNTTQTITLTATDTNSGVQTTYWDINDTGISEYTGATLFENDGNWKIKYYTIDKVGNTETAKTSYCAIDKTSPIGGATNLTINKKYGLAGQSIWSTNYCATYTNLIIRRTNIYENYISQPTIGEIFHPTNEWTGTQPPWTLFTETDLNQTHGCQFAINGIWGERFAPTTYLKNHNYCLANTYGNIRDNNTYNYQFRGYDNAGNQTESIITQTYYGDTTAPTTTYTGYTPGTWINTPPTITFTCTDQNSGCAGTLYTEKITMPGCASGNLTINKIGTETTPQLPNIIHYYSMDNVGNTEIAKDINLLLDTTLPTVNVGENEIIGMTFTKTATASDNESGIASYLWTNQSGTGNITFGTPNAKDTTINADTMGLYTIRLSVTDNAGNVGYDEFTLIWTGAPTTTLTITDLNQYARNFKIDCVEPVTGCKNIYYRIDNLNPDGSGTIDTGFTTITDANLDINANFTQGYKSITYFAESTAGVQEETKTTIFHITGRTTIKIYDETTKTTINDINVTLNGTTTEIDATGYIDYNILTTTTTNYTMTLTKTGYGTRYYQFDANKYSTNNDLNFYMLQTTQAGVTYDTTQMNMKYFNATGKTIQPNTYITITLDGNTVGRKKTDTEGNTTFFLKEFDTNYIFNVEGIYDTNKATVFIKRPIRKDNSTALDGNWYILITGSTGTITRTLTPTDNNTTVQLIPNTTEEYKYSIYMLKNGTNGLEYDDTCQKGEYVGTPSLRGDVNSQGTLTLQPIMVCTTDGTYTVYVKEKYTETVLKGAKITVYETMNGDKILASAVTDSTGKATIHLEANQNQYLAVTLEDGTQALIGGLERTRMAITSAINPTILIDYLFGTTIQEAYYLYYKPGTGETYKLNNGVTVDTNTLIGIIAIVPESDVDLTIIIKEGGTTEVFNDENSTKTTSPANYALIKEFRTNTTYDTNYTIEIYRGTTKKKVYTIKNKTKAQATAIENALTTNNNMTFLLIIIIITLAITINTLIGGYGLEILFLLSIMLSIISFSSTGVLVAGLLGVIYFTAPLIREQFKS